MKIKKMTAHFGALDGRTLELSEGLNVLYAPNESGKSTWCAFLRTMLFGVSTAQRARGGQKPDKLKYRPWSGEPMSGSMDLLTVDGPVTIRRWTERESQPMQAFSATVTGTETPVYGLTADSAGQSLTGVSAAVFERSAFIRQSGLEVSNDPELDRRISAIVSSGDEEISFLESEKRLKIWQRRRRNGKRGAIPELEAELDETRRTLEMIRTQGETVSAAEEELKELEARREELTRRMHRSRAELRKDSLSAMGAARRAVQEANEARSAAADELERAKAAVDAAPFGGADPAAAAEKADRDRQRTEELLYRAEGEPAAKWAYLPLILAVAAFALAILTPYAIPFAAAGCILTIVFAGVFLWLNSRQRAKEETLFQVQRILDVYGAGSAEEIGESAADYRCLWENLERARSSLETAQANLEESRSRQKAVEARAVNDLDFLNGDNEAARLSRELETVSDRIVQLRERRSLAEGQARALGDPMALESELAEGERRYGELLRQEAALNLALETLTMADGELQQRLSPELAKRAAAYFSFLTDGRYDEVTLTRDLTAKARLSGDAVGWDLDYLSAGAKDQLYLALRLAVCDMALPGEDPCPIVLDDALVTFDSERMARALELMRSVAEKRQVLLFTCHQREGVYFADDPAVAIHTLGE